MNSDQKAIFDTLSILLKIEAIEYNNINVKREGESIFVDRYCYSIS